MKSVQEVADKMYDIIKESRGQKKYTPRDLQSAAVQFFGEAEVDRKICKEAVRALTDSGRCIFTGYGGASYVEITPEG